MYKDIPTVNLLVSQSAKMAVADNFSLAESVRGLESAMAQFGMKSENYNEIQMNTSRILDVWTKLAHTGAASARDLTAGVERAGSAAYTTGVSFEFFNALLATGVRNTARSGAEIGQMLKSVFSSVHSDKAITEIQKMGIEVYKFGENGEKSFRPVQDVLLDVALKTQNTTKDTQALNQALSGGKWQWSKASAVFGDYKEILRNWENAVNSVGFTNDQVGIQMETLARKIQTLKTEISGLYASTGANGLGEKLKTSADSMSNFIRGLRESSIDMGAMLSNLTKLMLGYVLLKTAISGYSFVQGIARANQLLSTGATIESIRVDAAKMVSSAGVTKAIQAQATAQGMMVASTRALTTVGAIGTVVMGNWPLILATIAYGIYSVVSAQGEEIRAQEALNNQMAEQNESLLKSTEAYKHKVEFIDTLIERYNGLSKEIESNSGNTEENNKKVEQQKFMLEALARQLGVTTEELVKDGVLQTKTIDNIKKARNEEAKAAIQSNIDKMTSEVTATEEHIKATNTRIESMKTEIKAVGALGKAYEWLMLKIAQKQFAFASEMDNYANGQINRDEYDTDVGAAGQIPQDWKPSVS